MADTHQLRTKHGHDFGEAASALQKSIRRGLDEEAMYWALEFALAGFHAYLWKRLVVIVCEDIGQANTELVSSVVQLSSYIQQYLKDAATKKRPKHDKYDLCIVGYAILSMARSPKSRESDDFTNHVLRSRRLNAKREVPDYALDKHTQRGRDMGRGVEHFWSEGAKLVNELYPSAYAGWDELHGDGYHSADGKRAREANPDEDQTELPF